MHNLIPVRLATALRLGLALTATIGALQGRELLPSLPLIEGKTDLVTLLPKTSPDNIADQWQNGRYGIIVNKNSEIELVYSPSGERLFSASSWYLQGTAKGTDGKPLFSYMGSSEFYNGPITINTTREGYRIYEIKNEVSDYMSWTKRIICKPNAIRVEMEFTPTKNPPEGVSPGLQSRIRIIAQTAQPYEEPNANPINVLTYSYSFDIAYPRDWKWYNGYYINDGCIFFAPLAVMPFEVGKAVTIDYEVLF